ncbi:hypothetical protein M23134_06142 [Microscilla marina ATCC 23134]|uniref:Uncharacterized protein n=1 Tax=Microscilla marina ATCC 23134 TaxID=313606 RepID=A1ZSN3_MICM2|nr:hypothetical protein M23134_06142 [Microscilla marina ATCC 23134]
MKSKASILKHFFNYKSGKKSICDLPALELSMRCKVLKVRLKHRFRHKPDDKFAGKLKFHSFTGSNAFVESSKKN